MTQIALLLITGALLTVFFRRFLGAWPALFAATLCVHTANRETMNLISARSELLSTLGLLVAFVLYQRLPLRAQDVALPGAARDRSARESSRRRVRAVAVRVRDPHRERAAPPRDPHRLPSLVLGIVLLVFLNSMNAPEWTSGGGSAWRYAITQPSSGCTTSACSSCRPELTADTDWLPFVDWYDTRAIAGHLFVIALIGFAARASRSTETRAIAFGIAWFAIALAPTSSIFPLAEVANEHCVFFAYLGLAAAVVSFVALRARTMPHAAVAAGAIAVLIAFAIGTHARNKTWRTPATLWADVIAKSPANGRAWMNHGLTRMSRGDYAGTHDDFERAAVLTPNYWLLEINRGIVEGEFGDQAAAERHFAARSR